VISTPPSEPPYSRPAKEEAASAANAHAPAIVVTGGSSGIGLALARRFVADKALLLVARNHSRLSRAAAVLQAQRPESRVHVLSLDITASDAPSMLGAELHRLGYYADMLVNCAGAGLAGRFDAMDPLDLDRLIELNITALTRLTRHILPGMIHRGTGVVLNVASLGGYVPGPHQAAYYASKAYVISFTEAIASELSGTGVRICVLAPGPADTGFHARMGAAGSLYRRLLPQMSADQIATSAYFGLRFGRRVIIPGLFNIVSAWALRLLPHPLTVPFVGWLLRKRPDP
jgi:hypothetical protein